MEYLAHRLAVLWHLPLRIGEVCSLTVNLLGQQPIYVAAGIVRWVRDEEYGAETLVIDDESQEDLDEYLWQRLAESAEDSTAWTRRVRPHGTLTDQKALACPSRLCQVYGW